MPRHPSSEPCFWPSRIPPAQARAPSPQPRAKSRDRKFQQRPILGRVSTGSAQAPFQRTTVRRKDFGVTFFFLRFLISVLQYIHTNRKQTMNITAQISARILTLVATGVEVQEACRQVLGADKFDAMIGDLYDALRAKA